MIACGTKCYSILYCNSQSLYIRLKYTYSVISVIVDSLPGNYKEGNRRVRGVWSAISPFLGDVSLMWDVMQVSPCDTFEWVMSHIWIRHVTHLNESCHIYERIMQHIWMSHGTHMNTSRIIYISLMWTHRGYGIPHKWSINDTWRKMVLDPSPPPLHIGDTAFHISDP